MTDLIVWLHLYCISTILALVRSLLQLVSAGAHMTTLGGHVLIAAPLSSFDPHKNAPDSQINGGKYFL